MIKLFVILKYTQIISIKDNNNLFYRLNLLRRFRTLISFVIIYWDEGYF